MLIMTYLGLGAVAGLLAGLFGIGGGTIVVPVLIVTFTLQGFDAQVLVHMAVATSLANIIFTALSAVITHQKKGAILWPLAKPIGLGMLIGAFIGVNTALSLSGALLQALFSLLLFYLSIKMLRYNKPSNKPQTISNKRLITAGTIIGWVSAIFGIGGGNLLVSWLTIRGVIIQKAVATSAACGLVIGVTGALTNIGYGGYLQATDQIHLPMYSLGYVYLPALLGIVLVSPIFAHYGARLAHYLPAKRLQHLFAFLMILVAVNMLYQSTQAL